MEIYFKTTTLPNGLLSFIGNGQNICQIHSIYFLFANLFQGMYENLMFLSQKTISIAVINQCICTTLKIAPKYKSTILESDKECAEENDRGIVGVCVYLV